MAVSRRERELVVTRVVRGIYPPAGTPGVRPDPRYLAEQIVAALEALENEASHRQEAWPGGSEA